MTDRRKQPSHSPDERQDSGRERISRAAYELFSREGVRAVGVDAVIARAGTAKMTLYRNFPSKDDLIIDFLRRREELWTRDWLKAESTRRGQTPREQLLSIFDVFAEWFGMPDFEGCSFLTTMIEINEREHPVHQAAVGHLANIRDYIEALAAATGIGDTDSFARQWHILMKGSIMAAHEGDTAAAARARELGELLLKEHGCLPARARTLRLAARYAGQPRPSFSAASFVPSTRLVIFCQAVSRAKSGEPWFGFSSMLNGENPQSSVAPSCSFGMKLAARTRASLTSSGLSTRGFSGLITPM
jgi:AcrR family transcriptional regulator